MELTLPQRPDGSSHAVGVGVVVAVHLVVGYALVSGLAQKVVDSVREPFDARLIEAPKKPPPAPPPEPPKPVLKQAPPPPKAYVPPPDVPLPPQPAAPTIAATTPVPPPAPVPFAPEPAPAPPAPPAPPPAPRAEPVAIGVACPQQVAPVLPRRVQQEGISGQVRAQITVRGGKVVDVQILASKPRGVFDAAVRAAMLQYGCQVTGGDEIVAQQTFDFRAPE